MNSTLRMLAAALVLLVATSCNRQGPELPTALGNEDGQPAAGSDGIQPVTIDPNAAFVGSAVDATGNIVTPQREFEPGQSVYMSVPSKGRRLGSVVEVFWFHADGVSRKNEQKPITGPFTAFEFQPQDPGKYNTEIDVNGRPIGLVEFEVK